jgi:hypothetical protein
MGMRAKPISLKLNDANLRRLIQEAAVNTARVFFTPRARKRMRERKITPTQIYDCLRRGIVCEPAHLNIHWQLAMHDAPQTRWGRRDRRSRAAS